MVPKGQQQKLGCHGREYMTMMKSCKRGVLLEESEK